MTSHPTLAVVELAPIIPPAANDTRYAEIVRAEEQGLEGLAVQIASRYLDASGWHFVAAWLRFSGCRDYRRWRREEQHNFPLAERVLAEQRPAGPGYTADLALYHVRGRSSSYAVYAQAVACEKGSHEEASKALQAYRQRVGSDAERLSTLALSWALFGC
jgi:hypothetical protein